MKQYLSTFFNSGIENHICTQGPVKEGFKVAHLHSSSNSFWCKKYDFPLSVCGGCLKFLVTARRKMSHYENFDQKVVDKSN